MPALPPPPRIAITGIGIVSPFGVGRERYWDHVSRGVSGTRGIDEFDTSAFTCQVAAPLPAISIDEAPVVLPAISVNGNGHHAENHADPRRYSRASLAGVIAAREAWSDAGLRLAAPRSGVIVGSGAGGIEVGERQYREFFTDALKKVTPYAIPVSIVGMISSEISIALQLHGISHVLSTAARARPTRWATAWRCCAPANAMRCCRAASTRASRPA